jgi:hypothetical protein
LRPSDEWIVAPTGHTCSHGAFSQCTQNSGWWTISGESGLPEKYRSIRSQCISRFMMTLALPTTGTLFSAWQATLHALQPVHTLMSIVMPQRRTRSSGYCFSSNSEIVGKWCFSSARHRASLASRSVASRTRS